MQSKKYTREFLEYPTGGMFEKYRYHMNRERQMFETYAVDKVSARILLHTLRKILTLYYLAGGDVDDQDARLLADLEQRIKERLKEFLALHGFDFIASRCPWQNDGICILTKLGCNYDNCPVFDDESIVRYMEG